ncbi:TetR/AcrR family transcriptional regulator [Streptomyces sp. NPDC046862]|uniref:TetR/AcrR family transcriptional regulator n=1 Tax=Streptomyces sp. NPDC046862 TaxID=3154603 RepID=UPI0034560096
MQDRQARRVLRSRAALMEAAVRLVSERGTTALPVIDLSDAADVSRQLVYIQFGDRDALLVAAATDLVERELITAEAGDDSSSPHERLLAMARHFARHRPFYRAMLTGSCAFPMTRALNRLFSSLITASGLREQFGDLDETTAKDLKALFTGGTGAIVNDWVIEGEDPLVPEELADRLLRLTSALTHNRPTPAPPPGGHP